MTLYDHLYGPPRWTRWLNRLGWLLGLWLFVFPVPYMPLVIAVGVMPPLFLLMLALWPDTFTADGEDSPTVGGIGELKSLTGLWFLPCLAIGGRAVRDLALMDLLWPALFGLGVAMAMTLLCARLDRRMRGWRMAFNLPLCLAWGWGGLALLNVLADPTAGRVMLAEVVERRDYSSSAVVKLRLPSGELVGGVDIARRGRNSPGAGGRMCLEIDPGLFGWRSRYVVDCPLIDLGRPPSPR